MSSDGRTARRRTERIGRSGDPTGGRLKVLWLIKGLGAGGAERLVSLAATIRDERAFDGQVAYLLPWKDALAGELRRAVQELRGNSQKVEELEASRALLRMAVALQREPLLEPQVAVDGERREEIEPLEDEPDSPPPDVRPLRVRQARRRPRTGTAR